MSKYEKLSESCKIMWKENFNLTTEKYTQVSGYIFNDKNEMLIVKNGDTWTVPGGHPELYEYTIGTLVREVMEEACVSIKNIKYLGAVEVVESNDKYYQLRYIARVNKVHRFKEEWEINERKFVKLEDLKKYIKWCDGVTFKAQLDTALRVLSEGYVDSSISA